MQADFRPPADKPANSTYKVQGSGETLFNIAAHQLGNGDRWKEIAALNPRAPTDGNVLAGRSSDAGGFGRGRAARPPPINICKGGCHAFAGLGMDEVSRPPRESMAHSTQLGPKRYACRRLRSLVRHRAAQKRLFLSKLPLAVRLVPCSSD